MKALILVDLQNDFFVGGALAVKDSDQIVPIVNHLLANPMFHYRFATKDWHPATHKSFATNHQKKIGEHVTLQGGDQVLWPVHCVQNTQGAAFFQGWDLNKIDQVVHKGTDENIDSYSAFFDNCHLKSTGLHEALQERAVTEVYLCGLATDYCVKYSVLDALRLGYRVFVVVDGCRAVNLFSQDEQEALEHMCAAGALLIKSEDLKTML